MNTKKSRIGQNLMRTIEGGKSKSESMEDEGLLNKEKTVDADDLEDQTMIPGEPLIQLDNNSKPEKVKNINKKGTALLVAFIALLVSFLTIGLSVYLLINNGELRSTTLANMDEVNDSLGIITKRTDEVVLDLSQHQKNNESALNEANKNISQLRQDILSLEMQTSAIKDEIGGLKDTLAISDSAIAKNTTKITDLEGKIKKISNQRARLAKTPVKKKPVATPITVVDVVTIEGARLASIDIWGGATYAMLQEQSGTWVPLSLGESYRGWRLESVDRSSASFRKGSKSRVIRMEE